MIPEYIEQIIGNRKSTNYNTIAESPLGCGLITQTDDATWRLHRKIIAPAFHFNNLKTYIPVFHEETNILLAKLDRKFSTPYSKDLVIPDMVPLFQLSTFDMILRSIFGVRVHAQDQESHQFMEALHDAYRVVQHRLFNPFMSFELIYTLSGFRGRMERANKYCREFTESVIRQKRLELQNIDQIIDQKNSSKNVDDNEVIRTIHPNKEEKYSADNNYNLGRITRANTGKDPKTDKSGKEYTKNNIATHLEKDITKVNKYIIDSSSSSNSTIVSIPSRVNSTSTMDYTNGKQDSSKRKHKSKTPEEDDPDDFVCRNNYKSFLELLIEDEVNQNKKMTNEEIRDNMITLMFAGFDTTATTNCLSLLMLATHQDIQEKTFKEIDSVFRAFDVDDGHTPSYSELRKLELLDRVIKECIRLYPAAPVIAKDVTEDTPMGPFILPKGSIMLFPLMLLQRDPRYHPRPNEFWPDRFLPPNTMTKFSYIPFSAGSRNCLGQKYAMLQMKVVLSTILRKYKVSTEPSIRSVLDVDNLLNMSLIIKMGRRCPLVFTPRN